MNRDPVVTPQNQNGHHTGLLDSVSNSVSLSQKKSYLSDMYHVEPTSLKLSHVLSCPSPCTELLLTPDGEVLVFACEAIIVLMDIRSKRQQHLLGHTDVVTGLAIDPATRLLASSQSAPPTSYTCEVGVVHLWRLPDKTASNPTHRPIGTGRMESVRTFNGVALSENAEFLLAHGCDHAGSAMIVVWNAKAVAETAVLPLVTYTFTGFRPRQLIPLPLTSESERNKTGVVLRFMTTEGFEFCREAESQRFESKPNRTESGLCIWNLQESIDQQTLDLNAKTRRSFRSAQFTLLREAHTPSDLNFTDCCLKPGKGQCNRENGEISYTLSYSAIMCSSTGHLMEFDPNSCEVLHLYRIIKYRPDGNKGESSAKIYHLSGHKEATKYADCKPGVGLTNLAWIQQDFPTPHGWLVTGSDDGCLRLWDELSPTATPKLEVKYAGPICSLSVSLIEPISERQDVSKDTDGLPFATIALSTKTGGLAGLILSVEYPSDCCGGESGYPKLDRSRPVISGCTPMRLLSWPLDGPIVSTDLVSFNPSGSCSILCIATLHGSIKIWKLLSSTCKVGVSKTEFPGDVCLRNLPLFDLRVSGDPPCHVSLQPAVIEGQTSEITDYSWLRLGCGYRGTGLVRIFDPSSASLLYTLTTDNMCDVTAVVPTCTQLIPQSDLTLSPDDQKLVYVDQTHLLITVAQAYTLETLFQVDLNRAVDKNPGESFEVVGDQLDHRRILLNFSCRNPITDSHDLLVARPDGYLCRFEGSTGELIAHCRPPHSVNEKDDRKDHKTKYCEMQEGAYWSAMCVSPDGKHVVLAAAARPVLYTTTTDLCQLPDGPEKNYTNSSVSVPKFRQFVGHLHAISAILITGDQHFCLTVDGGVGVTNEASTPALGSAIYVWQLSKSKRRQITEHSLSGTALPRGNKTPREKSTAIPWTSEQHKTGVCFKEATPISQPNGENAITKSGNHPSSVPWQHSYRNSSPRDSRRPISTEFDRITWEESHLRFMPLRTYSGKCIHGLIGYTNQPVAVDSVVWDPDSGLFVYTADAFLICESLESGEQVVYATQLAKDGRQTNLSPVLIRELLNSLVLSPNRRLLVIGATALWSEAGQCMKSTRRLVTSAIVSMPVKFTRLYPHRGLSAPEQRVTLDYESVHRLHYSSILWHCLEANEAASIGPRTTPAPMLKTMAFSSSSQYLITAGDESAPIISCSFLYPMDFVTVGYVHREPPTPHQGHLLFWHIDNAEQKLVDEPPASTVECVDKLSTAIYLLGPETCNGNSPLWLQSVTLREILIVATATGSIDVWDPVRRCRLTHCPTGDAEMTPVASTKALSPANADSAAAIQFLGTSHLVMGTNRGFLILLRITARRSEWKLVPLRILKEHVNQNLHFNCVHQLEVFPSEVSFDPIDFTSRSVGTAFSKDLARKCERAIPGVQSTAIHMQSNRTFLSELKQIEQTPAWLWLAISGDRRLSVWLFIDRRQFECVNERVVSLERCHLIAWLLLDSLVEVRPIGKSENAAEKHHFHEEKTGVSGSDLGSNFKVKFVQKKPAHNKRTICAMAPLESISILIAHSNSINQTQLWLHSFYPTQLPMKLSTVSGMLDSLLVTPSKTTTNQSLSIEPTRAFLLTRVDDRVKLLSAVFDAGSAVCSDWVELIHLPLSTRSTGPNPPLLRLLPTNGDDFDHEASVVVALGANLIIL
ncbi:hypothetical protein T265_15113, partial [Opisthorchis viverrini]